MGQPCWLTWYVTPYKTQLQIWKYWNFWTTTTRNPKIGNLTNMTELYPFLESKKLHLLFKGILWSCDITWKQYLCHFFLNWAWGEETFEFITFDVGSTNRTEHLSHCSSDCVIIMILCTMLCSVLCSSKIVLARSRRTWTVKKSCPVSALHPFVNLISEPNQITLHRTA